MKLTTDPLLSEKMNRAGMAHDRMQAIMKLLVDGRLFLQKQNKILDGMLDHVNRHKEIDLKIMTGLADEIDRNTDNFRHANNPLFSGCYSRINPTESFRYSTDGTPDHLSWMYFATITSASLKIREGLRKKAAVIV